MSNNHSGRLSFGALAFAVLALIYFSNPVYVAASSFKLLQKCLLQGSARDLEFTGELYYSQYDANARAFRSWKLTGITKEDQPSVLSATSLGTRLQEVDSERIATDSSHSSFIGTELQPKFIHTISSSQEVKIAWKPGWSWPIAVLNDQRIAVSTSNTSKEYKNGFIFLNDAKPGSPATEESFSNFPFAVDVRVDLDNGFYVSPSGDRVVYDSKPQGDNGRIGLSLADVQTKQVLWSTLATLIYARHAAKPVWSPDGSSFVYIHLDDQSAKLYLAQVNREGQEQYLWDFNTTIEKFAVADDPIWSPDGTKLAFWLSPSFDYVLDSDLANRTYRLYILDFTQMTLTDTCHETQNGQSILWSPNSEMLAYINYGDLVLINLSRNVEIVRNFPPSTVLLSWINAN